jgi:hypothetical protein
MFFIFFISIMYILQIFQITFEILSNKRLLSVLWLRKYIKYALLAHLPYVWYSDTLKKGLFSCMIFIMAPLKEWQDITPVV